MRSAVEKAVRADAGPLRPFLRVLLEPSFIVRGRDLVLIALSSHPSAKSPRTLAMRRRKAALPKSQSFHASQIFTERRAV